ncbi:thioredoxin domain-containing protein [Virgibacillus ndiopensis]|uniref:thioredoxin domain-containing protein n=1 Tax=Virgibacillus ndiopensis TaxID=2004408 RepID=UPI000C07DFB5|nr:thioredoxin domain-containing protein [Virgibacillus ndiopensis]
MKPNNKEPNRLIEEKSPYLLQHAYNPVDWYPWGEEAFEKARGENKPIFLSIGYSSCHWCHVFAHESFEDEEVAKLLNDRFVSIKVDREERPDIDSVYMKVCQMMNGQGGWPLSIFLTPDKIPFYAGTYFPKESKYGMPGFVEVITQLYKKFKEAPEHIKKVTDSVTNALQKTAQQKGKNKLTVDVADNAFEQLGQLFDMKYGGFGGAPKFPAPHNLMFLLRYYKSTGKQTALDMVEKTLKSMASGGIYDHIGFGFARYSTDEEWLVPHFEKMLYDNALLVMTYTECYQVTNNPYFKQIAEQIITFVMREMTSKEGAFYSAIDADSEGVEGKYYVWDKNEVITILGDDLGKIFCEVYDITSTGNFEGTNIPNIIHTDIEWIASQHNLSVETLKTKLDIAREKLLEVRSKRVYPHVDDKILTSQNALMVAALAKAGKVFGVKQYTDVARNALSFIEETLTINNRLMVRYRDGEVKHKGYMDDYAFLLWAYIEMYDSTQSLSFLEKGNAITNDMVELFWDDNHGGFFFYGSDSEELITREKVVYDGAIPSGNSVAAVMLVRLAHLVGNTRYLDKVDEMYQIFKDDLDSYANASTFFMQSLILTGNPTKEVVVIGDRNDDPTQKLLAEFNKYFLPNVTLLVGESTGTLAKVAPFTSEYRKLENKTTVYVCENFTCKQPTTDIEKAFQSILH